MSTFSTFSTFGSNLSRGGGTRFYKKYIITVATPGSTPVFLIDSVAQKNLTTTDFIPGKTYRFDQSNSTNVGYPLVFGTTPDETTVTTAGVTYVSYGVPGSVGAYTKLIISGSYTAGALYYYNTTTRCMGYGPTTLESNFTNRSTNDIVVFTINNRTGSTLSYNIGGGLAASDFNNSNSQVITGGSIGLGFVQISYKIATLLSYYMTFNIDTLPTVTATVNLNFSEYTVTVTSNKYVINGVQLAAITFSPKKTYVFRQSTSDFATYPIKFGRTPDGSVIGVDAQWSLSVTGTTTTLALNASFVGVLYYYSTALTYMGYMPPTISVSRASSAGSRISQGTTFEFTIINNTSAPITFTMTSTQVITAAQLYTGASSAYSLVAQSVPIGTTIVYCKNQGTSAQTITCTVSSSGAMQTAFLAAPLTFPATLSSSCVLWFDASTMTFADNTTMSTANIVDKSNTPRTCSSIGDVKYKTNGLSTGKAGLEMVYSAGTTTKGIHFSVPANTFLNTNGVGAITVFIVLKVTSGGAYNTICTRTSAGQPRFFDMYNNLCFVLPDYSGPNGPLINPSALTTPCIFYMSISYSLNMITFKEIIYTSSATTSYPSSPFTVSKTAQNIDTSTVFTFGSRDENLTGLNGVMSEGIVFKTNVSDTDRDSIVSNLKSKWGI
jgi:hypothetical protein